MAGSEKTAPMTEAVNEHNSGRKQPSNRCVTHCAGIMTKRVDAAGYDRRKIVRAIRLNSTRAARSGYVSCQELEL